MESRLRLLCVGGPLHLQWVSVEPGRQVLYVRTPDPHGGPNALPQTDPLENCLELKEIEALTGNRCHRDPGRIVLEELERQELLTHCYHRMSFLNPDRRRVDMFIDAELPRWKLEEIITSREFRLATSSA